MARVILWNSQPFSWPIRTLGVYQLASWLRQNGYSTKVVEFCNDIATEDLVRITSSHIDRDTIAIGVSNTFWIYSDRNQPGWSFTVPQWVDAARNQISQLYPDVQWLMGGARSYLNQSDQWISFVGDAEDALLKWCDEKVGITMSRPAFNISSAVNRFVADDHVQAHEVLPIELGRGCMFKCKFCSWHHIGKQPGTYRRSMQCIADEILAHHISWGTTRFYYVDDTVNEDLEKTRMLARIADMMPFKLEWMGYIRADLMDAYPAMSDDLVASGLRSAFFGIESFEQYSSKVVGKGWSGQHAKRWLVEMRQRWSCDITWQMGLIVGLPGQTPQQLMDDTNWLIDNDMHGWTHYALWIEKNHYKSEFSINSHRYGYSFPDSDRPYHWHNGDWDYIKAAKITEMLEKMSVPHMRYVGFTLGAIASLGYTIDDIIGKRMVEFDRKSFIKKRSDMVACYVNAQLNGS